MKLNNEEIRILNYLIMQGMDLLTKSTGPIWRDGELNPKYTLEFSSFIKKIFRTSKELKKEELAYGIWTKEYLEDVYEFWMPCLKSERKNKIHPNANKEKYGKRFTVKQSVTLSALDTEAFNVMKKADKEYNGLKKEIT